MFASAARTHSVARKPTCFEVYRAVDGFGVNRVGHRRHGGRGHPTSGLCPGGRGSSQVKCDIEFHGHNDAGCAVANAFSALEAGATHIDTTVLGIGERNGITPLGGLLARLYTIDRDRWSKSTNSPSCPDSTRWWPTWWESTSRSTTTSRASSPSITRRVSIPRPCSITRKHTRSSTQPTLAWNGRSTLATSSPADTPSPIAPDALGLHFGEVELRDLTAEIKRLSDRKALPLEEVDDLLRRWVTA